MLYRLNGEQLCNYIIWKPDFLKTYFIIFESQLDFVSKCCLSTWTCLTCHFVAWPRGGLFILKQSCTDKPKLMHQSIFPLASHPALFPCHFTGGDNAATFNQAAQTGKFRAIHFVIFLQFNIPLLYPVLLWAKFSLISKLLCKWTNSK